MKLLRILTSSFVFCVLTVAALAADPTGTWKWTVESPAGDIATTLKLESKDGQLAGTYSNQFGTAAIKNALFKDDMIAFDVVRNFDGNEFVLKYRGKVEGDAIKGTIEADGMGGGGPMKLDWNAKRASKE
jgi:hypothetical protein